MTLEEKKGLLIKRLSELERVLVAYSGGVDSTFLLKMAKETLGRHNVIAMIADSATYPEKEKHEAVAFCESEGVKYVVIKSDEMNDESFTRNDLRRCYYCKLHLYEQARVVARNLGIEHIIEGSNYDDLSDYRPGREALKEKRIISPLLEAGLTKNDIRMLSKELGLKTHSKPAKACLASRIPYGTKVTEEILKKVELAENCIEKHGVLQVRVRFHGNVARIEVAPEEFEKIISKREEITGDLRKVGFHYITLDLAGYRTGSLNETIGN